jgi:hypothetical protein
MDGCGMTSNGPIILIRVEILTTGSDQPVDVFCHLVDKGHVKKALNKFDSPTENGL